MFHIFFNIYIDLEHLYTTHIHITFLHQTLACRRSMRLKKWFTSETDFHFLCRYNIIYLCNKNVKKQNYYIPYFQIKNQFVSTMLSQQWVCNISKNKPSIRLEAMMPQTYSRHTVLVYSVSLFVSEVKNSNLISHDIISHI